jgi:hypothetical protein
MMVLIWRWVVSLLVWLSADTERLATEPARAAAAVAAARAAVVGAGTARNGVESVAAIKTPAYDDAKDVKAAACVSGTCGVKR